MAGQNQRRTRSRRGMHRSHHAIKNPAIALDQVTGNPHLSHHMTQDGFYRGVRIKPEKIVEKVDNEDNTQTSEEQN